MDSHKKAKPLSEYHSVVVSQAKEINNAQYVMLRSIRHGSLEDRSRKGVSSAAQEQHSSLKFTLFIQGVQAEVTNLQQL